MQVPSVATKSASPRHRFLFIDGLRGIAAMSVVVFHILREPIANLWPGADPVLGMGFYGVIVFFVISGFVIAHTLDRAFLTPSTVGKFLLRRIARLDPPYWASMVLAVAAAFASARLMHYPFTPPTAGDLGAQVLYLQNILGTPSCLDVYWTLCFEIQFYLILAVLLGSKQRLERRMREDAAFAVVFWAPALLSLLVSVGTLPLPRGSCFAYWFVFATGVAAQRVIAGRGWSSLLFAFGLATANVLVTHNWVGPVTVATAGAVAFAGTRGRMDAWLSGPVFQHLGRISYSLYLTHTIAGSRTMNVLNRFVPARPWVQLATGLVGTVVAVVTADILWRLVERPSIELSRWLGTRTLGRAVAPAVERAAG